METERRYLRAGHAPVGVSTRSDGWQLITGYSAVFYRADEPGTEYRLWEDMVERIRPNAFDRAIKEKHDVRALFNHDPNNLLGRSTSGTCKYSVDKTGLKYEITCDPNDPDHQRVIAKIERGDLTGSSFAFRPTKVTWEENDGADSVRWIDDVNLYDVGPVTFPAYEASTTGLRSEDGLELIKEEFALWKGQGIDLAALRQAQLVADDYATTEMNRRRLQLADLQTLHLDEDPDVARRRQLDRWLADLA